MEEEQRNNRSMFSLRNIIIALLVLIVVGAIVYFGKDLVMPKEQLGGLDIGSPSIVELSAMSFEHGGY